MELWVIIVLIVVLGVVLCACLAVANFSYESYYNKFLELNEVQSKSGITVFQFFMYINKNFLDDKIKIYQTQEEGQDAYARGVLYLSPSTLTSNSLAAFAIIAHELGHALQDKTSNKLKRLSFLRRLGYFVGAFMFPLLIAGVVLMIIGGNLFWYGVGLAGGGALIFFLAILIKAITIKIEKEASQNAIMFLKSVLDEQELKTCRKFLNDAKLTYWGDMFRALLSWTFLTRKGKLFR